MFSSLQEKLESAFKHLKGQARITELNVAATVKDIRKALVEADVNYKIAKEFTDKVKEKAIGQKVIQAISPGQLMVKIVKDELALLMGGRETELHLKGEPAVVLITGLQGSGKTTFSAKLAYYLKNKKGLSPLLVAGDVYRPAAIDQLKILGEQIQIEVYAEPENKNPVQIAQNALREARSKNKNVVIIDTAGRLAIDEEMMTEVANIKEAVKPNEILFVVDSMTGQDAVNTAKAFNDRLDFTGVVLTKLDGDTRGGAALSIKYTVNKPIKFISTGEKPDTLDVFYPERMAQRILGMGDITTLVEKAQEQFDLQQAKKLEEKIRKNKFDFNDFKLQLEQLRKMGSMKDILGMMPGIGSKVKDLDVDDNELKGIEAIINSMTPQERAQPEIIDGSRKKRIAKGCGKTVQEVNQFLKQFEQMRSMMKSMAKPGALGRFVPGIRK
ncbi:MAG: signal recognition particle protein [Chitinophagaceae bacterium]|nr:signal recognition particle protein [Chitinophagaceae bacterium]